LGLSPRFLDFDTYLEHQKHEAELAKHELLVLDSRKATVEVSIREFLRIDPGPRARAFLFLLGHGVLLLDDSLRVLLTEDSDFDSPSTNFSLEGERSLANAFAQSDFDEVFVFYDACSKTAFGPNERQRLKTGRVEFELGEPNPRTAVTICMASTLYQPARDSAAKSPEAGTPFMSLLLAAVDPSLPLDEFIVLDEDDDYVIDLRAVITKWVAPGLRVMTRGDQDPDIHPLNARGARAVIPLLQLDLNVERDVFRARRHIMLQQAEARGGVDPVAISLDQLSFAMAMRRLHHGGALLRESVRALEIVAATDQDNGDDLEIALMSGIGLAARDLASGLAVAFGDLYIPVDLGGDFRRAVGVLRNEVRKLTSDYTEFQELKTRVEKLLSSILVPLRMTAEAAFSDAVWKSLHVWIRDPNAISPELGRTVAALWAYADDGAFMGRAELTPKLEWSRNEDSVDLWSVHLAIDQVRFESVDLPSASEPARAIGGLLERLQASASPLERLEMIAAYRSVAETSRQFILDALAQRATRTRSWQDAS
jgi:hypothetical protein